MTKAKPETESSGRYFLRTGIAVAVLACIGLLFVVGYNQHQRIEELEKIAIGEPVPPSKPDGEQPPGYNPDKFDAAAFYDIVRAELFGGSLTQDQVDGHQIIGFSCGLFKLAPLKEQCSYVLATVYHETARTMQPIEEYYGSITRYAPWFGRGFVQITHEENYKRQQDKMANYSDVLDAYKIPYKVHDDWNLALVPSTSAIITVAGMRDGDFTGHTLSQHINTEKVDYVEARRIVNGTDKARTIAGYAEIYQRAFEAALDGAVQEPSNHP